ncbi:MAG: hypothetical protein HY799_02320 [Nitrosomonadales bacterium]|nr:hypothetical protein [Nitrosomonadales bacterium]
MRPSRLLALSILFLGAASLAAIWSLPLHKIVLLVLGAVVLLWAGYHLSLDAQLRLQHSCVAFRLEEGDSAVLVLRNGKHVPCRLSADSLVTPYLVILNVVLNEQRGGRSLMILPDSMGAERFRRLRIALRWCDKADQAAR